MRNIVMLSDQEAGIMIAIGSPPDGSDALAAPSIASAAAASRRFVVRFGAPGRCAIADWNSSARQANPRGMIGIGRLPGHQQIFADTGAAGRPHGVVLNLQRHAVFRVEFAR